MSLKQKIYKFTLWLQDKLGIMGCVIYPRLFDYTTNKQDSINWFEKNCPFCDYLDKQNIVEERTNLLVIKNKFPYLKTEDHLLIIPKRHIRTWKELTVEELREFSEVISLYLDRWYLLLGRQFIKKWCRNHASIWHLHIHLILNEK